MLTDQGGTPPDEDKAREMIGKSDLGALTADTVALVGALRMREGNGKVGVIGFCWGGAMVDRVAVAAGPALSAGDRKSVVQGKSVSVRVDLGGRRIIKKKNTKSTTVI